MKFDKARNLVKTCLTICVVLCVGSIIIASLNPALSAVMTLLSALFFILSFAVGLIYCKCPYCGKTIMLGMFNAEYCPKCNRHLETGAKRKGKGGKKR